MENEMNKQRRFNTGIFLIIATMLFISGNLLAQQQPEKNGPPIPLDSDQILKTVVELTEEISLSEDQTAKILDLFQDHSNKVKAAVDKNQDQRERGEEMERLRKEFEGNVNALLNDKQKAGFDEFMKKQDHQPQQQRPNG